MATKKKRVVIETLLNNVERFQLDYLYDTDFIWLVGVLRLIGKEVADEYIPAVALALYDILGDISPDLVLCCSRSELTGEHIDGSTYTNFYRIFYHGLFKSITKNPRA